MKGLSSICHHLPTIVAAGIKATRLKPGTKKSLGWFLELNADKYADRPAILFEDTCITHRELNESVNQYVHYFEQHGIKKGDIVSVLMENRPELMMIIGALAKMGAIASLINSNLRAAALKHCLNITKGKAFIVGEEQMEAFESVREDIVAGGQPEFLETGNSVKSSPPQGYQVIRTELRDCSTENPDSTKEISLADTFAYVFTSGTTGMPKAVPQKHLDWVSSLFWFGKATVGLTSKDTLYLTLPLYHSNALKVAWPTAAANGSAIALRKKFSARYFWEDVRKFKATAFIYIGELCRYLINQPASEYDCNNTIKKMFGNGLRPEIWQTFKKRFAISKIYEFYGATEAPSVFTNNLNLEGTFGFCTGKYAICQYDMEKAALVRDSSGVPLKAESGQTGLLLLEITPSTPFYGYTDAEATKSKRLGDVFKTGDVWFNTGDLIRNLGFGHGQFVDRLGDTYRWKGENVSTLEVESVISRHSQIKETTVYGVQIPDTEGRMGMACLVSHVPDNQFNFDEFMEQLRENLPRYAIPYFLRFKGELETTTTFKVKKGSLKKEGYNVEAITDPLYVLLPGDTGYTRLYPALYEKIIKGKIRF